MLDPKQSALATTPTPTEVYGGARASSAEAPRLDLRALETVWLQVTGTVCNLTCAHCFISCGPTNDSHPFMTVDQVRDSLEVASDSGAREYYFTGGEPFMHPDIFRLIALTLEVGPLTILTNGVLIDDDAAMRLREIFDGSRYSLDLRVSLDGTTATSNDPIRGRGTFARIVRGIAALARAGLNPVLTVTEVDVHDAPDRREEFRRLLLGLGLTKPRLKYLAPFRIGREAERDRPYARDEALTVDAVDAAGLDALQCASCRMVTARGAYPCPILIEVERARMGDGLADAMGPIALDHSACATCYIEGVSCRT